MIANMGQRRKRAVLLAVIPGDVVEAAVQQCEETLHTKADASPEAIKKMVEAFAAFGVTQAQIEARCQRRLEAIRPAQIVMLRRIYASLKDEMSVPSDWFEAAAGSPPPASGLRGNAALRSRLQTETPPEDEPEEPKDDESPAPDAPAQPSGGDFSGAATLPPEVTPARRRRRQPEPTEEEIARSQEARAAVLGPEEIARLDEVESINPDPDVLVPFDAASNVQEWFARARERLREMQQARFTPDRFRAFRKANRGPLMQLDTRFHSYAEQLEGIIAAGERGGAALGYVER
jgi:hypothetical protein